MTKRNISIVLASALFMLCTTHALAVDLNGTTWVGTFQCKGVSAAGDNTFGRIDNVTLNISQEGTDAVVTANFGGGDIAYDGTVYSDDQQPAKQGVLGIVFPGNTTESSTFNELVWGKVRFDAQTGKGTFTGTGLRVSANPGGFDTCRWRFKTTGQ